jgi:hypothetical protein
MAWKTKIDGIALPEGLHFEQESHFLFVVRNGETLKEAIATFGDAATPVSIATDLGKMGYKCALNDTNSLSSD